MFHSSFWLCLLLVCIGNMPASNEGAETVDTATEIISSTVLNAGEKQYALDRHNLARSIVSPSAMNMLKLRWDEELAAKAQAYSRHCIYAHSAEHTRNTSRFETVGENLYVNHPEHTPNVSMDLAVTYWDDEKYNYTYVNQSCDGECGHYTQLVWDITDAIGCGITTCKNIDLRNGAIWPVGQLVVCHYGPGGNINDRHPYHVGLPCRFCPRDYWCENRLCSSDSPLKLTMNCAMLSFVLAVSALAVLLAL